MKVNITGNGIIPGLGTLAPIYNHDMTEREVQRLLNFNNVYVYKSSTGALITRNNLSASFADAVTETVTIVVEPIPETIVDTDDIVVNTILPEADEVVEETTVEETEAVTDEVIVDEVEKVTEIIPEKVVETKTQETNKPKFDNKYQGNKKR